MKLTASLAFIALLVIPSATQAFVVAGNSVKNVSSADGFAAPEINGPQVTVIHPVGYLEIDRVHSLAATQLGAGRPVASFWPMGQESMASAYTALSIHTQTRRLFKWTVSNSGNGYQISITAGGEPLRYIQPTWPHLRPFIDTKPNTIRLYAIPGWYIIATDTTTYPPAVLRDPNPAAGSNLWVLDRKADPDIDRGGRLRRD
ncbi:hypothetical protein C8R43DRAFT_948846 [Mycena crocata]|nr:hypothetical protein C8R43DRAFT_948846 [Mycena crocata]